MQEPHRLGRLYLHLLLDSAIQHISQCHPTKACRSSGSTLRIADPHHLTNPVLKDAKAEGYVVQHRQTVISLQQWMNDDTSKRSVKEP